MAYVAISRVRSLTGLHLTSFDPCSVKVCNKSLEEANRLRSCFRKDLPLDEVVKQKTAPLKRSLPVGFDELEPPKKNAAHTSMSKKRSVPFSSKYCSDAKRSKSDKVLPTGSTPLSRNCKITAVDKPSMAITEWRDYRYHPVDVDWQRQKSSQLGLRFIRPFLRQDSDSDMILSQPDLRSLKRISGDGNVLFRAMSYIITGSEDQHFEIRSTITTYMLSIQSF